MDSYWIKGKSNVPQRTCTGLKGRVTYLESAGSCRRHPPVDVVRVGPSNDDIVPDVTVDRSDSPTRRRGITLIH